MLPLPRPRFRLIIGASSVSPAGLIDLERTDK
jgi:hypothetical protein